MYCTCTVQFADTQHTASEICKSDWYFLCGLFSDRAQKNMFCACTCIAIKKEAFFISGLKGHYAVSNTVV